MGKNFRSGPFPKTFASGLWAACSRHGRTGWVQHLPNSVCRRHPWVRICEVPTFQRNKCWPVSPRYVLVYSINNQKSFEVVQVLPLLEAMILTHCRCCTTRLPTWLETQGCPLFLLATRKTWRWKGVIWFAIWTMNIYLIFLHGIQSKLNLSF